MFRKLKAEEIEVKVGNVMKGGYTLLLYKNARVDMEILDECVGVMSWQREHKEVKGNLYCGVGIWNDEKAQWTWKWDCGVESAYGDKQKGEASDSFKRACVNWGIGRELYTAPVIKVACETTQKDDKYYLPIDEKFRKFNVQTITYKDDLIDAITIVDETGAIVFSNEIIGGDFVFRNGKHQGLSIREVESADAGYLDWLLGNPKTTEYIRANILKYREEIK